MAIHQEQSTVTDAGVPRRLDYVPALDGVRAIAVVSVFLLHLARSHVPGGAFGVDVFFVLSAFLITGLLLNEKAVTGRVSLPGFYWRRACRLLPALFLWIVLASFTAVKAGQAAKVPWSIAGSLFYVSDFLQAWTDHMAAAFDQSWSLAVEEQFYFVWPILLIGMMRLRVSHARRLLYLAAASSAILAFVNPNYFLPHGHLLPLAVGCWAAEQRAHGLSRWMDRVVQIPGIGLAVIGVFVLAAVTAPSASVSPFLFIAVAGATALLLLSITSGNSSYVTSFLATPIPVWLGARSYGVYLYGLTIIQLVPMLTGLRLMFAAPVDVGLTLIVVAVSFRFVESPIRRRGRQWSLRASGRYADGRATTAN